MQTYKSPSDMKLKVVNKPRPEPKKLRELKRGATIMFRESPHMVVEVNLYHAIKSHSRFTSIDKAVKDSFCVLNLGTGRVYVPNDEEMEQPTIMLNMEATAEYI